MADSNVFYISYWVNSLLFILIGFFLDIQDGLGLYKYPKTTPTVPCTENCGRWEGPYNSSRIIAVAAANLPDGRILIWSAYAPTVFSSPDVSDRGKTRTAIIDPVNGVVTEEEVKRTNHDMFCPGTAYLPDQKIMITGGASSTRTTIYNIVNNTWIPGPEMNIGRGYHAMTLLGGSFTGGIGNKNGEIWHPDSNDWTVLPNVEADGTLITPNAFFGVQTGDNHMWLYTAPNTDLIFHAGPSTTAHWIDVTGNGRVIPSEVERGQKNQMVGCAVMYDVGKLLVVGGGEDQDYSEAYSVSYVYNLNNGEQAAVERGGDLNIQRMFCNAIVLPTGDVVVAGGQTKARKFSDLGGVLEPELWNPITKQFTVLAPMKTPRTYHSTCLLMKDARVACMGGGLCVDWRKCPNDHTNFEIFTPPYLANEASRPSILSFSSSVMVGGIIRVETNSPCSFAIVRLGAITHTINNDLRRIPLTIETETSNTYDLRVPSNTRVALPGLYWLFAINQEGVPSEGATVLVTHN